MKPASDSFPRVTSPECRRHRSWLLAVAVVSLAAPACSRSLVEQAVRARGGSFTALSREVEAKVYQGIPGNWTWEMAFRVPELYRWTLHTYYEDQHYLYDGQTVRGFVGSGAVTVDPQAAASLRTHARWLGVTSLILLRDADRIEWSEVAQTELPAGISRGLHARFRDDGSSYRLWFDAETRLVAAEGTVAIPMIGSGMMRASFSDFRSSQGQVFPFAASYTLNGEPLFDERVLEVRPDDSALSPESFLHPPAR